MDNPVEYVTVVEPVLEVTLICTGDVAPWQQTLSREGLTLPQEQAQIEMVLSAAEMKYMGVKFQEFSISLRIDDTQALLVYAFNSNRLFAFMERAVFRTPYYFAAIGVNAHRIQVMNGQQRFFDATLPETASLTHSASELNDFRVWLPSASEQGDKKAHYFNARLEGETKHYAIPPDGAVLAIGAELPAPLRALRSSNPHIKQWYVRDRARHSKSRTFTTLR